MKKILTTIIAFILLSVQAQAQNSFVDFQEEKDIRKKAEIGYFLWNEYLRNDRDSLRLMAVELLLSAADKKSSFAKAVGDGSLGSYLVRSGDIEGGVVHLKEAKKYFEKKEDYTVLSETLNELGNAHYLLGKYNESIKYYLSSIRYGGLSPDETAAFNGKLGLGRAYCAMGDSAVGIFTINKYKDEAVKLLKFEATADAYATLGMYEMEKGNNDLSREYYEKSVLFSGKSNSKAHLSHAYNNKAILHFNLGETDSALYYFEEALRIRERINHYQGIAESYYNIGFYYMEMGDYHNAYMQFDKSAKLANEKGFKGDELDALNELLGISEELGYLEEIANIENRIKKINQLIEDKSEADNEVIAYAQKVISETEMNAEVEEESIIAGSTSHYYWIIGVFVLLLGFFLLKRRKS